MTNEQSIKIGESTLSVDDMVTGVLVEELAEVFERRYVESDGNGKDTFHLCVLYDTLKQLGWEPQTEESKNAEKFILTYRGVTGDKY